MGHARRFFPSLVVEVALLSLGGCLISISAVDRGPLAHLVDMGDEYDKHIIYKVGMLTWTVCCK